jgi:WD40 repeat protein
MEGSTGSAPEAYLKEALEKSGRANAILQDRVRELEDAVQALKRSVFLLSTDPSASNAVLDSSHVIGATQRPPAQPLLCRSSSTHSVMSNIASGDLAADIAGAGTPPLLTASANSFASVASGGASVGSGSTPDAPTSGQGSSNRFAPFVEKVDLKAHSAAVYAVRFSPDGAFLVSVSFDRSVVVWSLDNYISSENSNPLLSISDAHRAPVVAVEWAVDNSRLVTGGYDASAAEWDIAKGSLTPVSRYFTRGLVNAVTVSPSNPFLFFAATSRCAVHMFDFRAPARTSTAPPTPVPSYSSPSPSNSSSPTLLTAAARGVPDETTIVIENDSPVNTIHVEHNGKRIMTGDHAGAVKTWDLRMSSSSSSVSRAKPASLFDTMYNDPEHRPITHIHSSPPAVGDDHGRCLAINSYDNYLRVYDRGAFLFGNRNVDLKPLHALRGVVNRNWPIKSSFFVGQDYRPPRAVARRPPKAPRSSSVNMSASTSLSMLQSGDGNGVGDDGGGDGGDGAKQRVLWPRLASVGTTTNSLVGPTNVSGDIILDEESSLDSEGDNEVTYDSTSDEDDDDHERSNVPHRLKKARPYRPREMPIHSSFILASGSADGNILLYDVGGGAGTGDLVQTLRGHKLRVHSAQFHPTEPILASAGADSMVKIWSPARL